MPQEKPSTPQTKTFTSEKILWPKLWLCRTSTSKRARKQQASKRATSEQASKQQASKQACEQAPKQQQQQLVKVMTPCCICADCFCPATRRMRSEQPAQQQTVEIDCLPRWLQHLPAASSVAKSKHSRTNTQMKWSEWLTNVSFYQNSKNR